MKRNLLKKDDFPEAVALEELRHADRPIVALKVSVSTGMYLPDGFSPADFSGKAVQTCVEDSWKTGKEKLGKAELILATVPLQGCRGERAIVGVFTFFSTRTDGSPDAKGYCRSHFVGVQPACEADAAPFRGRRITGFRRGDTNPVRYLGKAFTNPKKPTTNNQKLEN